MQFRFKPNGLMVSNEDFLADLRRVATSLGTTRLTARLYDQLGKYRASLCQHRFGGWARATEKAGLRCWKGHAVTTEQLLADIKRVGRSLNTSCLSESIYLKNGHYSRFLIHTHFRSWKLAAFTAGFTAPRATAKRSREELLTNLEQVWHKLGRAPSYVEMRPPLSACGGKPYVRCFGSWQRALLQFAQSKASAPDQTTPIPMPKPGNPRDVNTRLRYQVLHRDHFRCQACGKSPAIDTGVQLQIDHIRPWSKGGQTNLENFRTLCQTCNIGKSDLL